jgi:hypothetical protein
VGATKYDELKPDYAQLPPTALESVVQVLSFGAAKYEAYNWRKGFKWTRLFSACNRHIFAWLKGEDLDPESGLPHLAHAICCLIFLLEHQLLNLGEDDRYGKK